MTQSIGEKSQMAAGILQSQENRFGRSNERSASSSYFKQTNYESEPPVQFNIFSKTMLKKNEFVYFFRIINDWLKQEMLCTLIKFNLMDKTMFDFQSQTIKLDNIETMESTMELKETVPFFGI